MKLQSHYKQPASYFMSLVLYSYGQISLSVSLIISLQTKTKKQVLIVHSEVDDATRGCWQSSKTSETGILNLANFFHCGVNLPYFSFLQLACVFSCLQLLPFSIVLQVSKFLLQQHFSVLCFCFCIVSVLLSAFPRCIFPDRTSQFLKGRRGLSCSTSH